MKTKNLDSMSYVLPIAKNGAILYSEKYETGNPKVKGAGEAGAVGAPPAVINAVIDALTPVGDLTHIDMPASHETVWRALTHT